MENTMKLKKSQLRSMVKEAVYREVLTTSKESKHLAECVKIYLEEAPFFKEYKNIETKEQLMEFFGPFKKLGVADLEKMSQDKDVATKAATQKGDAQKIGAFLKDVESARKQLSSLKLTDTGSVQSALDNYVSKLIDLHQVLPTVDLDPKSKAAVSKPFAVAAYTLQHLSKALANSAEELFSAIPRSDSVYAAGKEAQDIEQAFKSSLKTPGQHISDIFSGPGRGMGIGRGRPPA